MPRQAGIWFREHDGYFYTKHKGEQIKLAKTKAEAEVKFHELMAEKLRTVELPAGTSAATKVAFAVIANAFLERSQNTNAIETYRGHKLFLKSFAKHSGSVRFCDLTPYHFNRWLETEKTWKDGGKRGAVNTVKACLNWWCNEHNIPAHPLQRIKGPPDRAREGILPEVDQQKVMTAIRDQPFKDFFFALQQTGCRPSEIRRVCPEHFDVENGLWVMPGKSTRKTGKPRIVFLTPAMVELIRNSSNPLLDSLRKWHELLWSVLPA